MLKYTDMHLVKEGTALIAEVTYDVRELTEGKTYYAIYGAQAGDFTSRPYVAVLGDHGEVYTCHLSRFKLSETEG